MEFYKTAEQIFRKRVEDLGKFEEISWDKIGEIKDPELRWRVSISKKNLELNKRLLGLLTNPPTKKLQ
jgi:hypothetical protein